MGHHAERGVRSAKGNNVKQFSIEFNRDYGIDRRTGWTVTWDGCVLSQLQPWLVVAVWKAIAYEWKVRRIARWAERNQRKPQEYKSYADWNAMVEREFQKNGGQIVTEEDDE